MSSECASVINENLQKKCWLNFDGLSIYSIAAVVLQGFGGSEEFSWKHIKVNISLRCTLDGVGFSKWIATTGKVEVPEGVRKEARLQYQHSQWQSSFQVLDIFCKCV